MPTGRIGNRILNWCAKWSTQIRRILRSNGSFFLNVGSAPSNPMLPHQIVIELTSASGGFFLQNTIHWIKSIAVDTASEKTKPSDPHLNSSLGQGGSHAKRQLPIEATVKTFGHFKPINSKRFLNDCHEYIFHFTKIGQYRARSAGAWRSVPGQKQHRPLASH